ncbi:hypothetical protein CGCA056_v001871 [Colletotrichum aenigma]|uniref:uncharacterized protein n=1 Tax=Colletotrichum aenigma TaxID=1215731 RepID=UPI001872A440|nr:uncharacterized protein CGCA056_v001871 [Colletotrichum aenigma]KAF5526766.1 hypothetical protein CGCA056_v001871 [Colletotrichum aenigma]
MPRQVTDEPGPSRPRFQTVRSARNSKHDVPCGETASSTPTASSTTRRGASSVSLRSTSSSISRRGRRGTPGSRRRGKEGVARVGGTGIVSGRTGFILTRMMSRRSQSWISKMDLLWKESS